MDERSREALSRQRQHELALTRTTQRYRSLPTNGKGWSLAPAQTAPDHYRIYPLSDQQPQTHPGTYARIPHRAPVPAPGDQLFGSGITALVSADLPHASFIYQPILHGTTIRLMVLGAGKPGERLSFHFSYANLASSHPAYEALSYVWGVPSDQSTPECAVYLGDRRIGIRRNLEQALHALRLQDRKRYLWVDAICINQKDDGERAHQVSLMGLVYKSAAKVIVWLAEQVANTQLDTATHEEQFAAVCTMVGRNQKDVTDSHRAQYSIIDATDQSRTASYIPRHRFLDSSNNFLPHFWKAISKFFSRTWFWRLWVFQEIALAEHAVARLGPLEMDWRWIGRAAALLRTEHYDMCQLLSIGGAYNAYLMFRASRMSDLPRIETDFLRLLRLTRQFEVSDKRDRVYGLLGITTSDHDAENGKVYVKADYTISTDELWRRVAIRALETSTDLSLLSCVQHQCRISGRSKSHSAANNDEQSGFAAQEDALPSWVPKWERVYRTTLSTWDADESFATAKDFPRLIGSNLTSNNLVLQGIQIGIVGIVFEPTMDDDVDMIFIHPESLRDLFETKHGCHLLASTLAAGTDTYGSKVENSHESVLPDLAALLRPATKPASHDGWYGKQLFNPRASESASGLLGTIMRACHGRRLFLTTNGFLGLCTDTTRERDIVCVLGGGQMPFVLHPVKQNHDRVGVDDCQITFELEGECYVEGLMQGEAIQSFMNEAPLQGPVPLELTLQALVEKWARRDHGIEKARKELESVRACRLEKAWFDIR